MSTVTKEELIEVLDEVADCIDSGSSEGVRHLSWRIAENIAADAAACEDHPLDSSDGEYKRP